MPTSDNTSSNIVATTGSAPGYSPDAARLRAKLQWNRDQLAIAVARVEDLEVETGDLRAHIDVLESAARTLTPSEDALRKKLNWNREQLRVQLQANHALQAEVAELQQQLVGRTIDNDFIRVNPLGDYTSAEGRIALSVIGERLSQGACVHEALMTGMRALLEQRKWDLARSIAASAINDPLLECGGRMALALCFHQERLFGPAVEILEGVDRDLVRRYLPVEWIRSLYDVDPAAAHREALALVAPEAGGAPGDLERLIIAQAACGFGDWPIVRAVLAHAPPAANVLSRSDAEAWRWLERWAGGTPPVSPAPVETVGTCISVTDYKSPDYYKTSTNIGDYVQTLAFLGHLSRHANLRLHGDERLTGFVGRLRNRIDPANELSEARGDITLVPMNRDASSLGALPDRVWHVAYGWHMHPWHRGRLDFPFAAHVRPVFISFHINAPQLLGPDAIAYLKAHGPVGCRDWETTDLLTGLGVPAFFSGCVTTTVRNVCRRPPARPTSPGTPRRVCWVDTAPTPGEALGPNDADLAQVYDWVRDTDLVTNLEKAVERLDQYADKFDAVVTSRLHCAVPCRSMGIETDFRPTAEADVRFEGLDDLVGPALDDVAQAIETKLAAVLELIANGADEATVYERWRDLCAEDVERARQRSRTDAALPSADFPIATVVAALRQSEMLEPTTPVGEPPVELAFVCDAGLKRELPITLMSCWRATDRPLRAWIITRGWSAADCTTLKSRMPEVDLRFLPADGMDYGPATLLAHTTVSTMDRLLLPSLLSEVDRVVYIDVDTVVLGDVGELFDLPLGDAPLAAAASPLPANRAGRANVYRPALRLDKQWARQFRRGLHARGLTFAESFNAGVLVLDLARMRDEQFCERFIPYAGRYELNDQEALNAYAADRRHDLPAGWNVFPSQQIIRNPKLIHWIGQTKPWSDNHVAFQRHWRAAEAAWRERECAS